MRVLRLWGLMMVMSLSVRLTPGSTQAQIPQVQAGLSVSGYIGGTTSTQDWQFTANAGESLSIVVNRTSGNLDPTVQLLAERGEVVAENDDRIPGMVLDAGIHAYEFARAGVYSIRVGSYQGAGEYRLWVVPAYARIWEAEDFENNTSRWANAYAYQQTGRLMLDSLGQVGRSILAVPRGQVAIADFYLQAEFEWIKRDDQGAFGLVVRAAFDSAGPPAGYYFLVNGNGTWTVQLQQNGVVQDLLPATPAEVLRQERLALGVRAQGAQLRFYANGELLGTMDDTTFDAGSWGLLVRSTSVPVLMSVDNALLAVPEMAELPRYPAELENWRSAQPNDIAGELAAAQIIPGGGRRALLVLSTGYQVAPQLTRVYVQTEPDITYTDAVVGVDVRFNQGSDLGCGLALRYLNDANQVLAYADLAGGAGLVNVYDGTLRYNTYNLLPAVANPLPDGAVRLLAVARGEWVAVYVNGRLLATHFIPPISGQIGVALLNYSTRPANCSYSNLWVWLA